MARIDFSQLRERFATLAPTDSPLIAVVVVDGQEQVTKSPLRVPTPFGVLRIEGEVVGPTSAPVDVCYVVAHTPGEYQVSAQGRRVSVNGALLREGTPQVMRLGVNDLMRVSVGPFLSSSPEEFRVVVENLGRLRGKPTNLPKEAMVRTKAVAWHAK